jgi:hypothetical protein
MRQKFNRLMRDLDEDAKARIKAAQQTGASDWLRCLPSSPSRSFTDLQWKIAARLRLGLKLSRQGSPQLCPLCNIPSPDPIHHPFTCQYSELMKARKERHNVLRDTLIGAFGVWGMPVKREPVISERANLQGDLEIPLAEGPCVLDTSVVHPSPVWNQQNKNPSEATQVRERQKCQKYEDLCKQVEKCFLPFVFQTFGGVGSQALDFFSNLKSRPACNQVHEPCNFVDSMRFRLSSRFMRLNSKLILKWFHLITPLDEGGVMVNH